MNPIIFAMRHPITMMVAIVAIVLGAVLAVFRMPIDIWAPWHPEPDGPRGRGDAGAGSDRS